MEERSHATYTTLRTLGTIANSLVFRIEDEPSRFYQEVERRTDTNESIFLRSGLPSASICRRKLIEPFSSYSIAIEAYLETVGQRNVLVDISSMPKRLFFFIIKRLLSSTFDNIIVTYAEPEKYSEEPLAENPQRWAALPGFAGPRRVPSDRNLIIALGYEPLGLPDLVLSGEFASAQVALLFPFPSSPERVAKNWKFARNLFPNIDISAVNIKRVDGINVPEVFDAIGSLTDFGDRFAMLAPFGPKPISLAMALYASKQHPSGEHCNVSYTQPTVYNPDYSSGIKMQAGTPLINAYAVRIGGANLY
ncbi:hypothetical protein [Rhizobium sp. C1]|uniref:hypothetical protein n=1 Tax=Rhizobium sp. C1 TaxID=1349799 RepID=UPI001E388D28|nr:hypothetical protein [Rhizobium sp. C1]MCD2178224.1 hypothetical protein [Rhizobium sp. C1]